MQDTKNAFEINKPAIKKIFYVEMDISKSHGN